MAISLNQHRYGFTQELIAQFSDSRQPNLGLSAFFPTTTSAALAVGIEVERSRQLVAVDVLRGTEANKNTFSKTTEKIFIPPYFNEKFDFTQTQGYDVTFGMGVAPNKPMAGLMLKSATRYLVALKNKINRAIEQQRASVLQTGTVTLTNGDSINYNRQASSMPVLTGANTWVAANLATADPLGDLNTGCLFLRQQGLCVGNEFNAIMGGVAMKNLLAFSKIQTERQIFSNFRRADIGMPILNEVTGLTLYGRVGTGDFVLNLWTYSDFYENADGTKSNYIADNNVVIIPSDFVGTTSYGGVPAVMGDQANGQYLAPIEADFVVFDLIDQVKTSWDFYVRSAPVAIPVSVDRIYTIQTA